MLVTALLSFCFVTATALSLLFTFLWVALYRAPQTTRKSSLGRSAAVVVLGDVGRSPRMCYHVQSLANEGWKVAVVGYKGSAPPPQLRRSSIRHHYLPSPPAFIGRLPRAAFVVAAPFKVLQQSFALFWQLCARVQPPPEVILVQTPPALPTLFVVRIVALLLGSRTIIDWHNLGFTILALRMGSANHRLVRLARTLERLSGRSAFAHLFVTRAMLVHLDHAWRLSGKKVVLHDRPPEHFRRSSVAETHALMAKLCRSLAPSCDEDFLPPYAPPHLTPFTKPTSSNGGGGGGGVAGTAAGRAGSGGGAMGGTSTGGHAGTTSWASSADSQAVSFTSSLRPESPALASTTSQRWGSHSRPATPLGVGWTTSGMGGGSGTGEQFQLREDRPALVVSSTSWTADEDFGMLLKAAGIYERRARELAARAADNGGGVGGGSSGVGATYREREAASPTDARFPSMLRRDSPTSASSLKMMATTATRVTAGGPEHGSGSLVLETAAAPPSLIEGSTRDRNRRASVNGLRPTLPNEPARRLPRMLVIVTGKGELRARYEAEILRLEVEEKWEWVRIRTAWLESADYPVLLGSADVGVSLHTSSSGLDLPMKVVDMLGCGLPVCALDFACLDELVEHGRNGLVFRDADELARQLESLLALHPAPSWLASALDTMGNAFDVRSPLTDYYPEGSAAVAGGFEGAEGPASPRSSTSGLLMRRGSTASLASNGSSPPPSSPLASPLPTFNVLGSGGSPAANAHPSSSLPWPGSHRHHGSGGGGSMSRSASAHALSPPLLSPIPHAVAAGAVAASTPLAPPTPATWSANWRHVVRPLLTAADDEDAVARKRLARQFKSLTAPCPPSSSSSSPSSSSPAGPTHARGSARGGGGGSYDSHGMVPPASSPSPSVAAFGGPAALLAKHGRNSSAPTTTTSASASSSPGWFMPNATGRGRVALAGYAAEDAANKPRSARAGRGGGGGGGFLSKLGFGGAFAGGIGSGSSGSGGWRGVLGEADRSRFSSPRSSLEEGGEEEGGEDEEGTYRGYGDGGTERGAGAWDGDTARGGGGAGATKLRNRRSVKRRGGRRVGGGATVGEEGDGSTASGTSRRAAASASASAAASHSYSASVATPASVRRRPVLAGGMGVGRDAAADADADAGAGAVMHGDADAEADTDDAVEVSGTATREGYGDGRDGAGYGYGVGAKGGVGPTGEAGEGAAGWPTPRRATTGEGGIPDIHISAPHA